MFTTGEGQVLIATIRDRCSFDTELRKVAFIFCGRGYSEQRAQNWSVKSISQLTQEYIDENPDDPMADWFDPQLSIEWIDLE